MNAASEPAHRLTLRQVRRIGDALAPVDARLDRAQPVAPRADEDPTT